MPFLVLLIVFLFFVWVFTRRGRALARGIEGRGLILSASSTGTTTSLGGQRFQVRQVRMDVEIPGRPPYEVSFSPMFPRWCEPFPGAALDVRVDPSNPQNVTVVGPAGSSMWMGAAVGLIPNVSYTPIGAKRSGCGTVFVVLVSLSLAFCAFLMFLGEATSSREKPETPGTPEEPEEPKPSPHVTPPSHGSDTPGPSCAAAKRCCEVIGHGSCQGLEQMPEATCRRLLQQEKLAATKLHKRCE